VYPVPGQCKLDPAGRVASVAANLEASRPPGTDAVDIHDQERNVYNIDKNSLKKTAYFNRRALLLECAAALILAVIAAAPDTVLAQATAHSPDPGTQATRSPALPAGQHDIEPGGHAGLHADARTLPRQGDDADREPTLPLWWRRSAVHTPLRSVTDEFEAAPAIDPLSRAPPRGYALDRRGA
jgi:hypothetical protein